MDFPLTIKYQALCQNNKDTNEKLYKLLEEDKFRSKLTKKQRKQIQDTEIQGKESVLINRYKKLVEEVDIESTSNVIEDEKQTAVIRMNEMEQLYDRNVLKK